MTPSSRSRHFVLEAAWSPCGHMVASAGADKNVIVHDVRTSKVLFEAKAHTSYVHAIDWSACGRFIATGSSDKSVKLWNAPKLEGSKQLLAHSSWVRFVRFSRQADRLVSGGGDRVIILWSVPEGQILQRIVGHEATLSAACWLSSRRFKGVPSFVSSDMDGNVKLWQHDRGMSGIMHMNLIKAENLPSAADNIVRYLVLSLGRNRASVRTVPRPGTLHNYEHESGTELHCAVWDQVWSNFCSFTP